MSAMFWSRSALPRKILHDLRSSYWFVPAAMALVALVAAIGTEMMDRRGLTGMIPDVFYSTQADAARSLLSVIAQAAIGAAGVMFSMTIVAVTFASTNFGPRLIVNFMQDRGVQISLGTLLATFVFALMVLRGVRSADQGLVYVPALGMTVALGLALVSVMVLIYFVHHVPEMLSLENVTARLGRALLQAIDCQPRPATGHRPPETAPDDWRRVCLAGTGYIQAVNSGKLAEIARDTQAEMIVRLWPGDFVAPHRPVVECDPHADLSAADLDRIRGCFAVGVGQTEAQNPLFLAQQLSEIIARALSPGINDPVTAITCLNWLHAALHALAARGPVDPAPDIDSPHLSFLEVLHVAHRTPQSYIADDASVTLTAVDLLDSLAAALPLGPRLDAARKLRADLVAEAQARNGASPAVAALTAASEDQ